jgi:hypothetical protein
VKVHEALGALEALKAISHDEPPSAKFSYAAVKNRRRLGEAIEGFELARKALLNKYGLKKPDSDELETGPQGEAIFYKVAEDGKTVLHDTRKPFVEAHNALLQEDLGEITLHAVPFTLFPENIHHDHLEALWPMILEEAADKAIAKAAEKPAA